MTKLARLIGGAVGALALVAASPAHAAPLDQAASLDQARSGLPRGVAYSSGAAGAGSVSAAAASCGVRVDYPHASYTTSAQIHTRAESFCTLLPVQANSISGTTYRSRWYGWQSQGSAAAGPKVTQNLRITVAINCKVGDWYRYRTEARGVAVIAGQTRTAAAYEQNDDEIRCNA